MWTLFKDVTIVAGGITVAYGNYGLYRKSIMNWLPAGCFVSEALIAATGLSFANIMGNIFKNKRYYEMLNLITPWIFAGSSLLIATAVTSLNLPLPLNPAFESVWSFFIPAAVIGLVNNIIFNDYFVNKIDNCINLETNGSLTLTKKNITTGKLVATVGGVSLALTGVANMSQIAAKDETKDSSLYFYMIIGGIGAIAGIAVINTVEFIYNKYFKNYFTNNSKNDNEITTNDQASLLSNGPIDIEEINGEYIVQEENRRPTTISPLMYH